jgi:hypothetical protein
MNHAENANGTAMGFMGIEGKTKVDLKLGTAAPDVLSCNSMNVSGFQNQFCANIIVEQFSARPVLHGSTTRGFTMNNLNIVRCLRVFFVFLATVQD